MTLILKQIFAFLRLLNSDTGTNQITSGLSLGIILGFAPFVSLQTVIVLLLVFIFRIQLGAAFLSAFFFKFIAFLVDSPADNLGRLLLESESLRSIWTSLYNMPIVPMTRFNNSIVMGSLVISLILAPISFFIFKRLVIKYRELVVERLKETKFWKAFAATKIYNWYLTYNKLY